MSPEAREHTCLRPRRGPFVNGVRIDPLDTHEFLRRIDAFVECRRSHVVHFIPADPTVWAMDDSHYREILNAGDLNVADGMSVLWACRLYGHRTERMPGAEALDTIARWGRVRNVRHFVFGSRPEVIKQLSARLEADIPGINLVGAESPPFRELGKEELRAASTRVRNLGTDTLWIGLGTPKQDFVAEQLRDLCAAPVILCVGAAFDFLAGTKRRAPSWMQAIGFEWLYRLGTEPRRLWRRYLIGNPRFVLGVLREGFRSSPR